MRFWTQERLDRVVKSWNEDGLSCAEIGRIFGKSRCAVAGVIHRMRLDGIRITTREDQWRGAYRKEKQW